MKTLIREILTIPRLSIDELVGTLTAYEAELENEKRNSRGAKAIAFNPNSSNADNTSSNKNDN